MTPLARDRATDSVLPRRAAIVARVALTLAYPLVILLAWRGLAPRHVGCILLVLLWLQRWSARARSRRRSGGLLGWTGAWRQR